MSETVGYLALSTLSKSMILSMYSFLSQGVRGSFRRSKLDHFGSSQSASFSGNLNPCARAFWNNDASSKETGEYT
jgi:hypothetical protein